MALTLHYGVAAWHLARHAAKLGLRWLAAPDRSTQLGNDGISNQSVAVAVMTNVEHRTPNIQRRTEENQERKMRHSSGYFRLFCSTLDVV
jgi:hypothetical protein